MKIKVFGLALVLSLVAGVLGACNQDTGGTGTSPSPGTSPAESPSPTTSP